MYNRVQSFVLTVSPLADTAKGMLHDIGTGDQNPPRDTANKLRTVPLWGVAHAPRHMHDLKSLTLENAIERHGGEAAQERNRCSDLTGAEKQALITFLDSL